MILIESKFVNRMASQYQSKKTKKRMKEFNHSVLKNHAAPKKWKTLHKIFGLFNFEKFLSDFGFEIVY